MQKRRKYSVARIFVANYFGPILETIAPLGKLGGQLGRVPFGPLDPGRFPSRENVTFWYRFHLFLPPFSNRQPAQGVMAKLEPEFAGRRKDEKYPSDWLVAGRTKTHWNPHQYQFQASTIPSLGPKQFVGKCLFGSWSGQYQFQPTTFPISTNYHTSFKRLPYRFRSPNG